MIIGTAGHIDHGKTSLVKALTGIDADRLKEEKARGITIDLGFAYQALPHGEVLGFVDVPGHEKLVRNMLAGATGIDHVLLVVAADDGPMPQTREHLAIIDLLGLSRGVVALTKCDLVDAQRLAEASAEVHTMLAGTSLAGAEVMALSSANGHGVDALADHLRQAAAAMPAASERGNFRLAVDRCFTLGGVGTVVTGTVVSGVVSIGDKLLVSPRGLPVRVRGIHAQNREATQGRAGQRCALNLAGSGLEKSDIQRGDWIVAEAAHSPTQRFDARLQVLASLAKPLAHWTPVHVHLGANDVSGRVVLLEGTAIAPGANALVQLDLDRTIGALHGDRFIIRDQSAQHTLGGGVVIDPFAPATKRRRPERLAVLAALEAPDADTALGKLLALDHPNGIDLPAFTTLWNLTLDEQQALTQAVAHRVVGEAATRLAFAPAQLELFGEQVSAVLAAHHRRAPDSPGLNSDLLRRGLAVKPKLTVFPLLLRELAAVGAIVRRGPHFSLVGHEPALLASEQKLWEKLKPWYDEAALQLPKLGDLVARDRRLHHEQVLQLMQKLARMGKVHAVSDDYFALPQHMSELARCAQTLAQADPQQRLNIKSLRETTGISRHLSMPLIEFFDRIGFTKRSDDGRHVRRDVMDVFDAQHAQGPG